MLLVVVVDVDEGAAAAVVVEDVAGCGVVVVVVLVVVVVVVDVDVVVVDSLTGASDAGADVLEVVLGCVTIATIGAGADEAVLIILVSLSTVSFGTTTATGTEAATGA